jgi:hypothetical protein
MVKRFQGNHSTGNPYGSSITNPPHPREDSLIRYRVVGCDVGRFRDRSAITILGVEVDPYRPQEPSMLVGHYHTFQGDTEATANHIYNVWRHPPTSAEADIVLDRTGLGIGVADTLENIGVPFEGVAATNGERETRRESESPRGIGKVAYWGVPKAQLVSDTVTIYEQGRLQFVSVGEAALLKREMGHFVPKIRERSGRMAFEAEGDGSDDLVFSLLLAVWWGKKLASHYTTSGDESLSYAETPYFGRTIHDDRAELLGSLPIDSGYPY